MKKQLLEEVSDWNKKAEELYKEKVQLEKRLTVIDLQLYHMSAMYNNLCERILK